MSGGGAIVPGWIEPSGRIASQRSQTVVAPCSTWYSHDGVVAPQQHQVRLVDVPELREGGQHERRARGSPSRRGRPRRGRARRARRRPPGARASGAMPSRSATAQPVWVVSACSRQRSQVRARDVVGERAWLGPRARRRPALGRHPPSGGRCARRTRWRGRSSRPWPPTVDRMARRGRASRRTASRAGAGRRRRAAPRATRPSAHAVELVGEHARVAVRLVHRPRHDRRRVGPAGPPEPRLARRARRRARRVGTPSVGSWSSARSRSQLRQNASASNSVDAVAANAWASPVQPSRSSRCGQSVGTETKLSRCDQTTFSWSRSSTGCEHAKSPRRGVSLLIATIAASRISRGRLDLGVAEAVERERGLQRDRPVVGEDVRVGRLGRPQRARVERAVRLEHLGVADGDACRRGGRGPSAGPSPRCSGRRRAPSGRRRAVSDRPPASRRRGPAGRSAARSCRRRTARSRRRGQAESSNPGQSQPTCRSRRSMTHPS